MTEPVFLLAFAMLFGTVVVVARTIAGAISGRGASRSELEQIKEQLEQQAAALDDARAHVAELAERLDFAERLLAKGRDRGAVGPGEQRG